MSSKEQSNFCWPLGLEPKTTLDQTSNNESSPEANTGSHKSNNRNSAISTPINQQSIDGRPIIPTWLYEEKDNDDYDTNHEENTVRTKLEMIEPIRLRGGGEVIVETVAEEDKK